MAEVKLKYRLVPGEPTRPHQIVFPSDAVIVQEDGSVRIIPAGTVIDLNLPEKLSVETEES